MYMLPMLLLLVLITARMNTAYHPHLLFKKHIKIKSTFWTKLLISQSDPVTNAKNKRADKNKLLLPGLVFYCVDFALCGFSVLMLLIPEVPYKFFEIDTRALYLAGDSVNEVLVCSFFLAAMFVQVCFHFLNTFKYAVERTTAKKTVKVIYILLIIISVFGIIAELWSALSAILYWINS